MPMGSLEASTYHNLAMVEDHRDPFDRMLIHQCIQMKMTLVSRDARMGLYTKHGLKCIWR